MKPQLIQYFRNRVAIDLGAATPGVSLDLPRYGMPV